LLGQTDRRVEDHELVERCQLPKQASCTDAPVAINRPGPTPAALQG
jgi:hypothetical protein